MVRVNDTGKRPGIGSGTAEGAQGGSAGPYKLAPLPHRAALPYNRGVDAALLDEMKRYIGFGPADEANIAALVPKVSPRISRIVERFYDSLLKNPSAQAVFTGGPEQMTRQRAMLTTWLSEALSGPYDQDYLAKRLRIGATHVRVGLPQQFMLLGMELIWQEVFSVVRASGVAEAIEKAASIHKLFTLDLAMMLHSYKATYSEQVRTFERSIVEERLTRAQLEVLADRDRK